MTDWSTYRLQDFIPYSDEAYFRMLERVGEAYWPLHIISILVVCILFTLAIKGKTKALLFLMGPTWLFVAYGFLYHYFAELNWAGEWMAWAFVCQAVLFVLVPLSPLLPLSPLSHEECFRADSSRPISFAFSCGVLLCAIVVYPLHILMAEDSWYQLQTFGLHADPTALLTLAYLALLPDIKRVWYLAFIPSLWLVFSSLNLYSLNSSLALTTFVMLCLVLVALTSTRRQASC